MMAMVGSMLSCRIEAFRPCDRDFRTAFLVHSDPVPLVVGTAMCGMGSFSIGTPFPIISRYSKTSPVFVIRAATALPRSKALPPPVPKSKVKAILERCENTGGQVEVEVEVRFVDIFLLLGCTVFRMKSHLMHI
jgi:hypothetical protein